MLPKFNNEIRIENSTLCNYACNFCPHSTSFSREKKIMSFEIFQFILDKVKIEVPQINHCTISGFGEAFLDPTIIKKIEYARGQNYNVHILTNGSLLSIPKLNKLFRLGVFDLRFSIHALESDVYYKITNAPPGSFIKVFENLEYAIENKHNTKIIITAVIIKENKNQIKLLIKHYSDKVDLLEIWAAHNWVDSVSYRYGDTIKKTCGRPSRGPLQIQIDSTINMCCYDYNGELLLGNFKKQSLEEIFNSESYLSLIKAHKNGTISKTNFICKKCDQLYKDNKNILIYSSKFKKEDRIKQLSTTYRKIK